MKATTMSLMDPLLKSVKYLIQEFLSVGEVVTDDNVYLDKFCNTVEQCFVKGIKLGKWDVNMDNVASKRRHRFWKILASYETDGPIPFTISAAIAATLQNKRIKTNDGRFRYIIRHCLEHKSLHVLVEFMKSRRHQLKFWYYQDQGSGTKAMKTMAQFGGGSSILIHEELSEQFRSLLLTCSTSLQFELKLDNSFFLDETWLMPATNTVEFVPTCELGIELIYIHGYGIVTKLKAGSVAADANNLGVGDLLVEMNGQILFPATFGGENDARSVWRYCRKHSIPCKLTVIKPRSPTTGGIYAPLRSILSEYHSWMEIYYKDQQKRIEDKQIKDEVRQVELLSPSKNKDKAPVLDPHAAEDGVGGMYQVHYIGEVLTGEDGGVMQIEKVIRQMSYKHNQKLPLKVIMSLTQIAVETSLVHDRDANTPLFSHKYADISSCGKILSNETRFCYIAGDTFCTISKQFKGYVFEAESLAQARTILNSIYQGFKRTTWFM